MRELDLQKAKTMDKSKQKDVNFQDRSAIISSPPSPSERSGEGEGGDAAFTLETLCRSSLFFFVVAYKDFYDRSLTYRLTADHESKQ